MPIGEAGKVAASAIDAMKGNPACLAAILLAGIFALLTYFALQRSEERSAAARLVLLERCFPLDKEKN